MKRILKWLLWSLVIVLVIIIGLCGALVYLWSSNLPYIDAIENYSPPVISEVYSSGGEAIGRFFEEKRIVVPFEELPEHLIQCFISAEDARFFKHKGIDILSILRAFYQNIKARKIEQGGSTITQQVARSLLLHNKERTFKRKVREALLAIQIEKRFSKERILYIYLNQIYLGEGTYGVEAAARTYFNKSAKELTLAESAILAGLPQAPSRYNPLKHLKRAKARQRYVLQRMLKEGFITKEQMKEALSAPVHIERGLKSEFQKAPYYTEYVRQYLLNMYGKELLYRGGLKIWTNLDLRLQNLARSALIKGLKELDKREGYRGPIKHLEPDEYNDFLRKQMEEFSTHMPEIGETVEALVVSIDDEKKEVHLRIGAEKAVLPLAKMKWARKPDPEIPYYAHKLRKPSEVLKEGDVVLVKIEEQAEPPFRWSVSLEQEPLIQGAILVMEPDTGKVRAMLGGRDFYVSQFNRAIQSRRQPGSAFKPIIYSAALDKGLTPATVIIDTPFIYHSEVSDSKWKPRNYSKTFYGPTILRTALAKSRNIITVKILKRIGINYAIEYAKRLGIESSLSPDLSLALGSSGVSLMELLRAYACFANGGRLVRPYFIEKIIDRDGRVIYETHPESEQVISPATAYVMTDLLKAVVNEGTGWRVKRLGRPCAGKTGTTDEMRDAWFIGYTPELITGVWVGYDDRSPMGKGETGSRAASPIWLYFMKEALRDRPIQDFKVPDSVVFARIDSKTGLLAGPYSEKSVFQAFIKGTEPKKFTPPPNKPKSGDILQFDMEISN